MTIVGARPQFIKAAAVSRVFRQSSSLTEVVVHTGQHYDRNMSDVFWDELSVPEPQFNLQIGSGSHGAQTGRMLEALEKVVQEVSPTAVMVYGDTNSTLAGALVAAKMEVPVIHVEAGLRSYRRFMPEEINRVLTDRISDILFTPTKTAVENLRREGVEMQRVFNVGDVMYDIALLFREKALGESRILDDLGLRSKPFVLVTAHRAENTKDGTALQNILDGISLLAKRIAVVFPVHPRCKGLIQQLRFEQHPGVHLIEPVGYFDMLALEAASSLILTDSGGVQKEAFFQAVPCVTLREETEWTELVEAGWNRLVPPVSGNAVFNAAVEELDRKNRPERPPILGDGHASQAIVEVIEKEFCR